MFESEHGLFLWVSEEIWSESIQVYSQMEDIDLPQIRPMEIITSVRGNWWFMIVAAVIGCVWATCSFARCVQLVTRSKTTRVFWTRISGSWTWIWELSVWQVELRNQHEITWKNQHHPSSFDKVTQRFWILCCLNSRSRIFLYGHVSWWDQKDADSKTKWQIG